MIKCPKCQFENREGAKFCKECGAKLELACPKCDAFITPDGKFCDECGYDLSKPTIAPPVRYSEPQSYTPRFLADKILTIRSSIEGERKLVTVLFADVANYTSISEKIDPEEVHQMMDGCFKILMDEIHRYEGTINQFAGDGVMALFGAPLAHEDHAQHACYAALAIQKGLGEYEEQLTNERGIDFKMRIGLNSGPVIVGSIGDDLRMDYTAIGDTTNLAARMQSNAKPGGILISEQTYRLARDYFEFESAGSVQIKGKKQPQEAWQLIKTTEIETRISAAVAKGLSKFVGRKKEIEALQEAFEKARSGKSQVVGIVGEAGVGKSRLLLELKKVLAKSEYTYLEGHCLHYGASMPYLPILYALRSYIGIKEGEQEPIIKAKMQEKILGLDKNLKSIIPPLQEMLSLKVEDEGYIKLEPKQKREKIFEAIRDLVIRAAQERPLILAIEDLHWIDKTTEDFFDYLIGCLAKARVFLILLYRPEYTHPWGSKSYYFKIGVDQLSIDTSTDLVRSILDEGELAPELKELILSRTSGNPLFVEELTRTLLENGSIQKRDNQYVLSSTPSDIQVPDTIQGIISARIDRLEDSLKKIMQVASVIGREFAYRILGAITEMKAELKVNLHNLQGLEFIYEKQLFPELEYIFKHALTQEVAYNSLLFKRRREIHEKIGKAVEDIYADRLEEFYEMLSYHYSKSDDLKKAFHYLKLSGKKAMQRYSLWESFRFYKAAITILKRSPETKEKETELLEMSLLIYGPMRLLGFPEESLQILQEGEQLSKKIGDKGSCALISNYLGSCYSFKGDPPLAKNYQENALYEAEQVNDLDLVVPISLELCSTYSYPGEFYRVPEVAYKAISFIETAHREKDFFGQPRNPYANFHAAAGVALAALGRFKEGEDLLDKSLRFSREINDPFALAITEYEYGAFFIFLGDGAQAVYHQQEAIKLLEQIQYFLILGFSTALLGWGYFLLGDYNTACNHTEKAMKIDADAGLPFGLPMNHLLLSEIHYATGDSKKAIDLAKKALNFAQKFKQPHMEAWSNLILGRAMVKTDINEVEKAEEFILKGIQIFEKLKLRPFTSWNYFLLGELYINIGRKELALNKLKKAESSFQKMGMDIWLAKTKEVMAKL